MNFVRHACNAKTDKNLYKTAILNNHCQNHSIYFLLIFQVYNETIRDLLMPGKALAIREDPQRGVCVSNLTLHQVNYS